MKHQNKIFAVALVAIALAGAARTEPTKQVLLIRPGDITPRTDSDTTIATYYTVSYSPPRDLPAAELERAILELYVDVRAKVRKEYVNEAPVLEVYALTQPFSDTLDPEKLDRASRVVQPVAAGEGRRVVFDVTKILRSHLDGRLENNGLIIGSLTGMREGEFTFVAGRFPEGAVGRITVYRRHDFVAVDVPSERARRER